MVVRPIAEAILCGNHLQIIRAIAKIRTGGRVAGAEVVTVVPGREP